MTTRPLPIIPTDADPLAYELAQQMTHNHDLVIRRIKALDWVTVHLETLTAARLKLPSDRIARDVLNANAFVLGSATLEHLERLERAIERWKTNREDKADAAHD